MIEFILIIIPANKSCNNLFPLCFQIMKILILVFLFLFCNLNLHSQILVEEIKIECGNNFFSEAEFQSPLIVRGKFCGNSYYWTPINEGDSITEKAYRNHELFTGECIAKNNKGLIIGKYTFNKGKITSLIEFDFNGNLDREYFYSVGIANGKSTNYFKNGKVRSMHTYLNGTLEGPFLENIPVPDRKAKVEEGAESIAYKNCFEGGVYINGKRQLTSKPCDRSKF